MTSLPLHPAVVHLPLGLALIIPVFTVLFALVLWSQFFRRAGAASLVPVGEVVVVDARRPGPRAWIAVVALQAVLLGAGLVAMNTGEQDEERVERVVPEAAIERHEEYAQQFVWGSGLMLALAALVLVFRRPPVALWLVTAAALASLLVAALALRVGKAGGELVYAYNAGAAYSSPASRASTNEEARRDAADVESTRRDRRRR
jgi:uncharacterized membrane protein